MPHITTAMRMSVRRRVSDILADGLLRRRGITGDVTSVKDTFSSWSNCMSKTYCKIPVIVAMAVGGLIILSILTCIMRVCCCGRSCCCRCFSFLKCFDCCGDTCAGKKNKKHKHLDDPYPNKGYQSQAPMMVGALASNVPQVARFEVGKNGLAVVNDDALPPMPSWENAAKKHVIEEEKDNGVELGNLDPKTGQTVPLMSGAVGSSIRKSPSPPQDRSPYGSQSGQGSGGNGYTGVAGNPRGNGGYRGSPAPGPGRGMGGRGQGYGGQDMNAGRGYGGASGEESSDSLAFTGEELGGGYGRAEPQRQYSNDSGRAYPPQPTRQYSSDSSRPLNPGRSYADRPYDQYQTSNAPPRGPSRGPGGQSRMASPPINNPGFDFGTEQYEEPRRPSQPSRQGSRDDYFGSTPAPPSYATRTPPVQEPTYPGYKPYTPPNQGGRGGGTPSVLTPGSSSGRGREPQGWDPVRQ